jgi:tetratricopeptide (TPR) repeat protein
MIGFDKMRVISVVLVFFILFCGNLNAQESRVLDQFYRGKMTPVIRALKQKTLAPEERLLLANAYFKSGQFAEATSLLQTSDYQALSIQPFAMFLRLQLAVQKKDLVAAQRFYTTILRGTGESDVLALRAGIELGSCMVSLGQTSEAAVLLRSLARKTDNPEIHYLIESLFFNMALSVLDKESAKKSLKAMCLTGARIREEASLFRQFRLRFGETLPLSFVFSDTKNILERGDMLIREGLFDDAISLLNPWVERGVASRQDNLELHYLLAQAYYFKSEYRLALSFFERVLFLGEASEDMQWSARIRLAECMLRIQNYEDALRYISSLQAGPLDYRAAGQALYIRYLIEIKQPASDVVRAVKVMQKSFPRSPDIQESALDAWYYALASGYSPMPDPPMSRTVAQFFASWKPKHLSVSSDKHILEQLPLGYTALALLEASGSPVTSVSAEKLLAIRAGFGQVLLGEKSNLRSYKDDVSKAKLLNLMQRPYQAITLLRRRLLTAPRDSALWKNLDMDWVTTLFPRIMLDDVTKASQSSGLEPNLILSVMRMESTFNTEIKSRAGALGVMQLMPNTASSVAQRLGIRYQGESALLDPSLNIRLGSFYLAEQIRIFKGSLVLGIAAYNAGPTTVRRWIVLNPDILNKTGREQIALLPYAETRRYVSGVLDTYAIYSFLENKGF